MDYTTLGPTGLKVSVAGLGCGGFSRLGLGTGGTEASAIAHHPRSARPRREPARHRRGLRHRGRGRQSHQGRAARQVVICTKARCSAAASRLTPERVVASLDNSLRELGIDCIDVFQLHAVPPSGYDYVRDVIAPVLLREKEKGKFRFLGITETSPNDLEHEMLLRAAAGRDVGHRDGRVPHDAPERARGRSFPRR